MLEGSDKLSVSTYIYTFKYFFRVFNLCLFPEYGLVTFPSQILKSQIFPIKKYFSLLSIIFSSVFLKSFSYEFIGCFCVSYFLV